MRVLGKPDLDNSVLLDDLELLLKHYGVELQENQVEAIIGLENSENLENEVSTLISEQKNKKTLQSIK